MLKYWRAFRIWNPQFWCCHSCAMPTSQEFLQGEQLRLSWHLLPPMLLLLSFLFFFFLLVFLWWLWLKLWWCCCWLPCQEIPMMCIYPPLAINNFLIPNYSSCTPGNEILSTNWWRELEVSSMVCQPCRGSSVLFKCSVWIRRTLFKFGSKVFTFERF